MSDIRRIMITVAYDGTDYHGWQYQEGVPTIEGELMLRLKDLTGEDVPIIGGSRTDAGVHARGNVAVFDTTSRIPAEKFPAALNTRLPETIRVLTGREVAADFHPRHCESRKTYEYRILNTKLPDPLRSRYTYWYYGELDAEKMHAAAQVLVGEHDFTSFCSVHAQSETRVRTILSIDVRREILQICGADVIGQLHTDDRMEAENITAEGIGNVTAAMGIRSGLHAGSKAAEGEIVIRVTGNGFLYNMVRIIAGTLLDVGRGHTEVSEIEAILAAKDREEAGPTAPPQGLTLERYEFV